MLSRIIAIVTVLLVSMGCMSSSWQINSSVYTRNLVDVSTMPDGSVMYTFIENQVDERNGVVVNTRPTMYASFLCLANTSASLETMNATGIDDPNNACDVIRRFNYGTEAFSTSSNHQELENLEDSDEGELSLGHNRDNEGSDDFEEADVPLGQSGQIGY